MKVLDLFDTIDDAPGKWVEYQPGVEFFVRAIPPSEQRRIENKYMGNQRRVVQNEEGRVVKIDSAKTEALLVERAAMALLDSRGAEFSILGSALAEKFTVALGEKVEPGALLKLDGRWTQALRELVLSLGPTLRDWLNEKATELVKADQEEEEGKDATS
jgi:hypothetical protein